METYLGEHHLYRLITYLFIEQFRLQQEVLLASAAAARVCGKVVKAVLAQSLLKNDVFIVRGLLGLVFTFYWVEEKSKKLLYQNAEVGQCEVWKRNDFWEAAIFETTYEEMAVFSTQKGETQAEVMLREKNTIFSQLASFCHYMVMLGTSPLM